MGVILPQQSGLGRTIRSLKTQRRLVPALTPLAWVLVSGCWSELNGWGDKTANTTEPVTHHDGGTDPVLADGGTCGGSCNGDDCMLCGIGETCSRNSDCESRVCNGTCLPAGCGNGVRDEGESDKDCGGSCDPCDDGRHCEQDPHCLSNVCEDGFCQAPSCDDDTQNGEESDQDCGGDDCGDCSDGDKCREDEDCKSGFCGEGGVCADPSCGDDSINGSETDLNCGGGCPDCVAGKKCKDADDCDSQRCERNDDDVLVCLASACDDDILNGGESDEDCGGDCDPCDDGKTCVEGTDCASLVCEAQDNVLTCIAPSCEDERENGAETGKDCGGDTECLRCPVDEGCVEHADCASNSCKDDVCQKASCSDGRLNQNEIAKDCGGDCDGCPAGTMCTQGDDCRSGHCDTTCQPGGTNTVCEDPSECLSGECEAERCTASGVGVACYEDADCLSHNCGASGTCGPSGLGQACKADADCVSASCDTDAGECLKSNYVIKTDAGSTSDQQITFQAWVERGASDPVRQWGDFAMMYFFTPPAPVNGNYDFVARYYGSGPDQSVRDNRFIAREADDGEWVMIWRATSGNSTVIPTAPMANPIELQLHDEPALNFTDTGDYSYVAGSQVVNDKVVVCQRVDERWIHTQGVAPDFADSPCQLVVDTCPANAELLCDVMQRRD